MTARGASRSLAATVGLNIRAARKSAGLTQGDIARRLNLSDAMAVSRWERGLHRPSDENLVALAELLTSGDVGAFYREEVA